MLNLAVIGKELDVEGGVHVDFGQLKNWLLLFSIVQIQYFDLCSSHIKMTNLAQDLVKGELFISYFWHILMTFTVFHFFFKKAFLCKKSSNEFYTY